jgi:hypothetical protein
MPVAAGVIVAPSRPISWGTGASGVRSRSACAMRVEALLGSWLIERWFGADFNLENVRRVLGFLPPLFSQQ